MFGSRMLRSLAPSALLFGAYLAQAEVARAQAVPTTTTAEHEAALAEELRADLAQQVVSGASRTAETSEQAPVAASVVRAEDLRRYGIRTLAEALRFLAMGTFTVGGQINSNEIAGARGVAIDGDSTSHFLVIVDGNQVNQSMTGGVPIGYGLGVPISMIDSIEVIIGPGSVVYGGSAMLGVLNVRTKPARQMEGLHFVGEYALAPSQNADGDVKNFSGTGLGQSYRLEATYGKTFQLFDRDGEFTLGVLSARTELPDVPIKAQTQFAGAPPTVPLFGGKDLHGLVLDSGTGGYARVRVGRFASDIAYVSGRWPFVIGAPQVLDPSRVYIEYTTLRANIVQNVEFGAHFTGFAALRAQRYGHPPRRTSPVCPPGGVTGSRCTTGPPGRGDAFSQQLELQGTWDFLADGRYQLMLGIDGRLRQVGVSTVATDDATGARYETDGAYKSKGQLFGAYTQFRGQPAKWLALNLGIRADWIRDSGKVTVLPSVNPVTYGSATEVTNHAFSPRVAAMFFPTDSTTLYGAYSRAFRAPSPNENFLVASTIEPSVNLGAETVNSGEIGLKQKIGVHRLMLSGFASKWDGLIGFVPGVAPGKQRYDSVGDLKNFGVNLGVEGTFVSNRAHYGLTFTYGRSRRTLNTAALSSYPPPVQQAIPQAKDHPEVVGAPEASGNGRVAYDFQGYGPEVALVAAVYGPRLTNFGYTNRLRIPPAMEGGAATNVSSNGYVWRSNIDPKFTDPMVELRLHIAGPIPRLPALRYHVFANYLLSPGFEPNSYGPTPGGTIPTVGAVQGTVPTPTTTGQLFPATKLTLGIGLEVVFGP